MLTVTIKTTDGSARTIEATEVYACAGPQATSYDYDEVHIYRPDGEVEQHTQGTIFVMNDKGATVAKYDFTAPRVGSGSVWF